MEDLPSLVQFLHLQTIDNTNESDLFMQLTLDHYVEKIQVQTGDIIDQIQDGKFDRERKVRYIQRWWKEYKLTHQEVPSFYQDNDKQQSPGFGNFVQTESKIGESEDAEEMPMPTFETLKQDTPRKIVSPSPQAQESPIVDNEATPHTISNNKEGANGSELDYQSANTVESQGFEKYETFQRQNTPVGKDNQEESQFSFGQESFELQLHERSDSFPKNIVKKPENRSILQNSTDKKIEIINQAPIENKVEQFPPPDSFRKHAIAQNKIDNEQFNKSQDDYIAKIVKSSKKKRKKLKEKNGSEFLEEQQALKNLEEQLQLKPKEKIVVEQQRSRSTDRYFSSGKKSQNGIPIKTLTPLTNIEDKQMNEVSDLSLQSSEPTPLKLFPKSQKQDTLAEYFASNNSVEKDKEDFASNSQKKSHQSYSNESQMLSFAKGNFLRNNQPQFLEDVQKSNEKQAIEFPELQSEIKMPPTNLEFLEDSVQYNSKFHL